MSDALGVDPTTPLYVRKSVCKFIWDHDTVSPKIIGPTVRADAIIGIDDDWQTLDQLDVIAVKIFLDVSLR